MAHVTKKCIKPIKIVIKKRMEAVELVVRKRIAGHQLASSASDSVFKVMNYSFRIALVFFGLGFVEISKVEANELTGENAFLQFNGEYINFLVDQLERKQEKLSLISIKYNYTSRSDSMKCSFESNGIKFTHVVEFSSGNQYQMGYDGIYYWHLDTDGTLRYSRDKSIFQSGHIAMWAANPLTAIWSWLVPRFELENGMHTVLASLKDPGVTSGVVSLKGENFNSFEIVTILNGWENSASVRLKNDMLIVPMVTWRQNETGVKQVQMASDWVEVETRNGNLLLPGLFRIISQDRNGDEETLWMQVELDKNHPAVPQHIEGVGKLPLAFASQIIDDEAGIFFKLETE